MKLPVVLLACALLPLSSVRAQPGGFWDDRFGPPGVDYIPEVAFAQEESVLARTDGQRREELGEPLPVYTRDLRFVQAGDRPALNFGRRHLERSAADASYFPLAEGNEWMYYDTIDRPEAPPDTITSGPFRVDKAVSLDGELYHPMTIPHVFGDTLRVDSLGRIWSYEEGEQYLLYDFTLPDGASYTYHEYTITVRHGVSIEVAAGRFENCIELYFDIPEVVDDAWSFVFAPDVGPVVASGGLGDYLRLYRAEVDGRIISSGEAPSEFAEVPVLTAAYPNPFTSTATFTVSVPAAERVVVALYDVLGREVIRLHDGILTPGVARTFSIGGAPLASGVYYYRVRGETFARTRRIVRR